VSAERSICARSWVVSAVSRSVATFAPERRAQPQVGWQRGGERADAQAAPAVDLDVSPGQHRVGPPVGEYQRTISTPERHVGRRALRLLEGGGTQADLAGNRAAERQAGPVEDERLTSPEFGLGPVAEPHYRRTGGLGTAHEQHLHYDVFHVVAQDGDRVTDPAPTSCLGDDCPSSALSGPVRSGQVRLGRRAPAKSRFVAVVRWPCVVARRYATALIQAGSQLPATGIFGHSVQTATLPEPWVGPRFWLVRFGSVQLWPVE
jgi:hypothetical protein